MDGMDLIRKVFATYPFKTVNGISLAQTDGYTDVGTLATCVLKTGDQTVAGIKTFSSMPVFPSNPVISDPLALVSGIQFPVATKTANYTLTLDDFYVRGDCTSGTITLTLPAASTCLGQVFIIKRVVAGANNVIISGTVDGASSITLSAQYQSASLISNGTDWEVF